MRNKIIFFALCISVALNVFSQGSAIYFTENQQQWDSKILFRSQLYQGYVFLEKNCLTYYFLSEENSNHHHATASLSDEEMEQSLHRFLETGEQPGRIYEKHPDSLKAHAYQVSFANMNSRVRIYGYNQNAYTENYFHGSDKRKWARNVRSFNDVIYENIYKNIDLHLYGNTANSSKRKSRQNSTRLLVCVVNECPSRRNFGSQNICKRSV